MVRDDEAAITAALEAGAAACDAVLTSGGVSMGDFDYVKVVLDRIGDMRWMQIAIRPAKPLAFGLVGPVGGRPVFGLPGNPVSSMVSFELFARPGLRRMAGHADDRLHRPRLAAVADEAFARRPDGKVHFVRVVVRSTPATAAAWSSRSAGARARTSWRPWPAPTGWPCCPTATASTPATPSRSCCCRHRRGRVPMTPPAPWLDLAWPSRSSTRSGASTATCASR